MTNIAPYTVGADSISARGPCCCRNPGCAAITPTKPLILI